MPAPHSKPISSSSAEDRRASPSPGNLLEPRPACCCSKAASFAKRPNIPRSPRSKASANRKPRRRSRSAWPSTAPVHRAGRKRPNPMACAAARSADQPTPGPANPPPSMPSIFRSGRGCRTPAGPLLDKACLLTWIALQRCSISGRTSTMTSFGNLSELPVRSRVSMPTSCGHSSGSLPAPGSTISTS